MFIKTFEQLSKNDVKIAGGKGASLGEMTKAGLPVPPGFVILAGAFDKFLAEADLTQEIVACLARINFKDINSVDRASNVIRYLIHDVEMPKDLVKEFFAAFLELKANYVAVRSSATAEDSATASWAGVLESYLNTTKKNLLDNVKNCWASLYTPRAISYRREKKLRNAKVGAAVAVQTMVQSEISGICFTAHPVTEDKNQMIIEAGWGLGEAIVGGRITPDTYIMQKSKIKMQNYNAKCKIIDRNISEQKIMIVRSVRGKNEVNVPKVKQSKQKLADEKIIELAEICLAIEKHYGRPQDIEWAYTKGKFYILQSRLITTLK